MADMYSIVKKQDEKIDDLLKEIKRHNELLGSIDTRLAAIPAHTASEPSKIEVELPPNIATIDGIRKMLNDKFKTYTPDETLQKVVEILPDCIANGVSGSVAKVLEDNLGVKVESALKEGIKREFAEERSKLYDIVNTVRYKAQSIVDGQWWRAIPKWVYYMFTALLLAAGGFGYGFFYQLNENSKLRDVEWLYRNQRTAYNTEKSRQFLINTERDFITGTWQERDSIKDNIRRWEKERGLDKTYLYFNPTER